MGEKPAQFGPWARRQPPDLSDATLSAVILDPQFVVEDVGMNQDTMDALAVLSLLP